MRVWAWLAVGLVGVGLVTVARGEDEVDEGPLEDEDEDFSDLEEEPEEGRAAADSPEAKEFAKSFEEPEEPLTQEEANVEPLDFQTPPAPKDAHFADAFPDAAGLGSKWVVSEAKKDGAEAELAKYNGEWEIGAPDKVLLSGDNVLVLKTKARHAAVATRLAKPFRFAAGKPLIVQYDVKFQNGQECGGAYIKLLQDGQLKDLKQYTDKTPYSIMFGPDKCGMSTKIHTIFRFTNPTNGTTNEHHATQPDKSLDEYITDKKSHLYRLEVDPTGAFRVSVDQVQLYSGDLASGEGLSPPILQPREVPDPKETKPADWDEREKIPDPDATKPEDWDEDAPEQIPDDEASKPSDWLEDQEPLIPDPKATKPEDWDTEMDGEWEAPRISNPACEGISGCGKWERPSIRNPAYKGKWRAPLVKNPNYQGKWKPQLVANPAYFEATEPAKLLLPIGAIGLELWTMSEGMAFDNFLVTSSKEEADAWAAATWGPKAAQESREASKGGFVGGLVDQASEKPWLWAVYLLVALIPIVGIVVWCSKDSKPSPDDDPKKTDAPVPDDLHDDQPPQLEKLTKDQLEDEEEEGEEEEEEEEEEEKPKASPKRNLRQRKAD